MPQLVTGYSVFENSGTGHPFLLVFFLISDCLFALSRATFANKLFSDQGCHQE